MKNVSSTKSGLISTNISRGGILEHKLLKVYDDSTNRYHAVKHDTIINYLTKSAGWSMFGDIPENHKVYSTFSPLRVLLNQSNFLTSLLK